MNAIKQDYVNTEVKNIKLMSHRRAKENERSNKTNKNKSKAKQNTIYVYLGNHRFRSS